MAGRSVCDPRALPMRTHAALGRDDNNALTETYLWTGLYAVGRVSVAGGEACDVSMAMTATRRRRPGAQRLRPDRESLAAGSVRRAQTRLVGCGIECPVAWYNVTCTRQSMRRSVCAAKSEDDDEMSDVGVVRKSDRTMTQTGTSALRVAHAA